MKNIWHLISALFILTIGLVCLLLTIHNAVITFKACVSIVLSLFLILRGTIKLIDYIKSQKQNNNDSE